MAMITIDTATNTVDVHKDKLHSVPAAVSPSVVMADGTIYVFYGNEWATLIVLSVGAM